MTLTKAMIPPEFIDLADGAPDYLDAITRQYTSHPAYYGYIYPVEQQARETGLIVRIRATKITLDAIHR
jgi:hypothetical protein